MGKKVVVKVGTSSLTEKDGSLSKKMMLELARQLAALQEKGHDIVLVTSGSVAAGRDLLREKKLLRSLPLKQMLSSVGQVRLMHLWGELFSMFGLTVGQVLLTRGDVWNRHGYLNVRNTIFALLHHGVVPVVNENDTVTTQEIKLGDNDNLSALVANLIAADLLILLTDKEGLYTADPAKNPGAKLIPVVETIDSTILSLAKGSLAEGFGTGGMLTKVQAADLATRSGTPTIIAHAGEPHILEQLVSGKRVGTYFKPAMSPKESKKRWLLSEEAQGDLRIDGGAEAKLRKEGASLLPVGATKSSGNYDRGSVVRILSQDGTPIALGISNYSHQEAEALLGRQSSQIEDILGYSYGPELIHRDNMALLKE